MKTRSTEAEFVSEDLIPCEGRVKEQKPEILNYGQRTRQDQVRIKYHE